MLFSESVELGSYNRLSSQTDSLPGCSAQTFEHKDHIRTTSIRQLQLGNIVTDPRKESVMYFFKNGINLLTENFFHLINRSVLNTD
jgi:hypothetical protein